MRNEAALKNIPPEGYEGGLIIDEMSIQPDLQFKKRGGDIQLINILFKIIDMSLSSFSHNVTSFSSGRAISLKELLTVTCCIL
jgi:hypothetical protein